jgi:hypothetical protein
MEDIVAKLRNEGTSPDVDSELADMLSLKKHVFRLQFERAY